MPLDQRGALLPPDNRGGEDAIAYQPSNQGDSPLPPDPPGREDIMAPEPRASRAPR